MSTLGLRRVTSAGAIALMMAMAVACASGNDIDRSSAAGTTDPAPTDSGAPWMHYAVAADCGLYTPEVLPSGVDPGPAQPPPEPFPADHFTAWGEGRDQVAIGKGREVLENRQEFPTENLPEHLVVTKDGVERHVVPVGDPGAPIMIEFVIGDCPYVLWLPGAERDDDDTFRTDGYTPEEAVEYANRF